MPDPKPPRKPATVDRFRALLAEVAAGNGRVSRDLLDRIRIALARKRGGTGRKRTIDHDEVMRRHAAGQTGAQIAREMGVSRQAVSFIVGMYRKMANE